MKNKSVTGIILAGGKSRRMGTDKASVLYKGEPFIKHCINALLPLVDNILLVSNLKIHETYGYKRVEDVIENAGPLAGLYSGLEASETEVNLVLSCDVPLITTEVLSKLLEKEKQYKAKLIVLKTQTQIMPLIGCYNKGVKNEALRLLELGERRMMVLLNRVEAIQIQVNKTETYQLQNINTPTDLNTIAYGHTY